MSIVACRRDYILLAISAIYIYKSIFILSFEYFCVSLHSNIVNPIKKKTHILCTLILKNSLAKA